VLVPSNAYLSWNLVSYSYLSYVTLLFYSKTDIKLTKVEITIGFMSTSSDKGYYKDKSYLYL
jgi:hypothetical protein